MLEHREQETLAALHIRFQQQAAAPRARATSPAGVSKPTAAPAAAAQAAAAAAAQAAAALLAKMLPTFFNLRNSRFIDG